MQMKSLVIGGLLPAILLGVATVFMNLSLRAGNAIPAYLVQVGSAIVFVGLVGMIWSNAWGSTPRAGMFATVAGLSWGIAVGAMAYAISRLQLPVSVMAPLTNSNAIVAVALSAWLFKEGQNLDIPKVAAGTFLIILGVYVVSSAQIEG